MEQVRSIALLPPDDRPGHFSLPLKMARLAGYALSLPPRRDLGWFRTPGHPRALGQWLLQQPQTAVAIVAAEALTYGGGRASSAPEDSLEEALHSLTVLEDLRHRAPERPLYVSHALASPSSLASSPLTQRLLEYLNQGIVDYLVLVLEGPPEAAFQPAAQPSLLALAEPLGGRDRWGLLPDTSASLLVLLARFLNRAEDFVPRVRVGYASEAGVAWAVPGSHQPFQTGTEEVLKVAGGRIVGAEDEADLVLWVNPPHKGERSVEGSSADPAGTAPLRPFVHELARTVDQGLAVAVADAAFPGGADPLFLEELAGTVDLPRLAAYAGWGAAGDAVGTAVAQACAWLAAQRRARAAGLESATTQEQRWRVLRRSLQKVAGIMQVQKLLVLLRDEARASWTALPLAKGYPKEEVAHLHFPAEHEFWRSALAFQIIHLATGRESDLPGAADLLATLGLRNALIVPLMARQMRSDVLAAEEVPMGVLCVGDKRDGDFTEEDRELLRILGRQVAAVLRTAGPLLKPDQALEEPSSAWKLACQAHQELLLARFIADWGYQTVVRREIEATLPPGTTPEDLREGHRSVETRVRARLEPWAKELFERHWQGQEMAVEGLPGRGRIEALEECYVTLPWPCTAEAEVEVRLSLSREPLS